MKKQFKIVRAAQKTAKVSGLLVASAWTGLMIYIQINKIRDNGRKIAKIIQS
jgi:hypothetical protein